jgi:hypothetical protein
MKPYPVVVTTICSLCGLPWDDHGDKPTAEDCVRLLLVELAKTPNTAPLAPYVLPVPYPVYPRPYSPYGWPTITCQTASGVTTARGYTVNAAAINASSSYTGTVTYRTPDEGEPPEPVAA